MCSMRFVRLPLQNRALVEDLVRGNVPAHMRHSLSWEASSASAGSRTRWQLAAATPNCDSFRVFSAPNQAKAQVIPRAFAADVMAPPEASGTVVREGDMVPEGVRWRHLQLPLHERPPVHSCQLTDLQAWAVAAREAAAATQDSFVADNGPSSEDLQVFPLDNPIQNSITSRHCH